MTNNNKKAIEKLIDHQEIWGRKYNFVSLFILLTPKLFSWLGFLLIVGGLKIIDIKLNTLLSASLYKLSHIVFLLYTIYWIYTPTRYFAQKYKSKIESMTNSSYRVSHVVFFSASTFIIISFTLMFQYLLNGLNRNHQINERKERKERKGEKGSVPFSRKYGLKGTDPLSPGNRCFSIR